MSAIFDKVEKAFSKTGLQDVKIYENSVQELDGSIYALVKTLDSRKLAIVGKTQRCEFQGELVDDVLICPTNHENALALRKVFSWTSPEPVRMRRSFGAGDRIGVATPGHIKALKNYDIFPVLAQQSIREMTRTVRTSDEVMDDASWAVFQEGFTDGFGSDADHLKTEDDLRNTFNAGFTGFTLDPSDHINNDADTIAIDELEKAFSDLFENVDDANSFLQKYADREILVIGEGRQLKFKLTDIELKRLAVKYLAAIRHTIWGYNLLKSLIGHTDFDFEMSVDETETPTTVEAHYIVANELLEAGAHITSLAPRFVGEFQKAVDYIGNLDVFKAHLIEHCIVAEHFGPYKISIHSGSDKFSVFPIVGRETKGLFHEKTAGTSYLEALRIVCRHDFPLFREIFAFSLKNFETERFSYHVTTDMDNMPNVDDLSDDQLESLLDENDTRQVLHIGFGSTLTTKDENGEFKYRQKILNILYDNEDEHYDVLADHFVKHVKAFGVPQK